MVADGSPVLSCVSVPLCLLIFEKWESVCVCDSQGMQESSGCIQKFSKFQSYAEGWAA